MPVAEDKPAVDAILLKVMESVPFQLTTDGGVKEVRRCAALEQWQRLTAS
jgi:acetyl esterase